jgi:ABC-2 type transport system permease protein
MVAPERLAPATPSGASVDGAAPGRYGEIFDRGYKHYDGPRLGRRHAIWALILYSIKRAMGIKKSWTAKVIPILLYTAVALIVAIPVGLSAFVPDFEWPYEEFFVFIFSIEGIFVATIAPEMVCGDRRENVLPLYFSRAISRADYVLAKLAATALLTLSISLVPAFILWLGLQLLDDSPLRAIWRTREDLLAIVVTGSLIALYLGAIGLVISCFTGRKSIAVAVIVIGFLISTSAGVALFEALRDDEEIARYTIFLSPVNTILGLAEGMFDSTPGDEWTEIANFSPTIYAAFMLGVVALSSAVMYLRYRPNE